MLIVLLASCLPFLAHYPPTEKEAVVDTYHGVKVADPYQWMEEGGKRVDQWVEQQNRITLDYIEKIPGYSRIQKRLIDLNDYTVVERQEEAGGRRFYLMKEQGKNQSTLWVDGKIILDPNLLSEKGLISLTDFAPSKDGKHVACILSESGSDWGSIHIFDVKDGHTVTQPIPWVKFSSIAWDSEGFFYAAYAPPKAGEELFAELLFQKVYYYHLKTEKTHLVYENSHDAKRVYHVSIKNGYLILYEQEGAGSETGVMIKPLQKKGDFTPIVELGVSHNEVVRIGDDEIWMKTNEEAPNFQLVAISIKDPKKRRVLLPETDKVLYDVIAVQQHLFVCELFDGAMEGKILDMKLSLLERIDLNGYGQMLNRWGAEESPTIYFNWSTFTQPFTSYAYNTKDKQLKLLHEPKIAGYESQNYEIIKQTTLSRDGTALPYYLIQKKGLKGAQKALLTGYGGFGVSYPMVFRSMTAYHLENGGVYAVAILRGGGERGEHWHQAGKKEKKQNVFDDFIAVAEQLVHQGNTTPASLGIFGSSNGGLLVSSVMLQRPDLFAVVLDNVGVHDMLRFHRFTIGWAWVDEYGSSANEKDFQSLYRYSPLHNVKKGVEYPALLLTTGDHDDRVVPAHSYKFAATLQAFGGKKHPYLLFVERNAGHGGGKPKDMLAAFYAKQLAFFFCNTSQ